MMYTFLYTIILIPFLLTKDNLKKRLQNFRKPLIIILDVPGGVFRGCFVKRRYLIMLLGLIVILTSSYSRFIPVEERLLPNEIIEIMNVPVTIQKPVDPVIARMPDVIEFDPNDIQLYIKEQCHSVGVSYHFAVSLLREENPLFFRLFEGSTRQDWVFEVRSHNENGSTDYGLWQLNGNFLWVNFIPNYWHDLCEFDWKNPYHNTYIAIRHIKWLYTSLQRFYNQKGTPQPANTLYWETALAYNAGLDKIRGGSALSDKTLDYAARILERIY